MKRLLILLWLLGTSVAFAQKAPATVKGILLDGTASGRVPLEDATVSIMSAADSSLVSFTLSSNSGYFEIRNLAPGNYYLLVSYLGFETLKKPLVATSEKPVVDLGDVKLEKAYTTLKEVVIADMAPIRVKGDTVEFNSAAFKTKPNANVEDLLKKLPGVQVEKDGTIKAQGESVQKVYVDGKEFFGNDPKLATQNLGADMVESVQVYDEMSEQARFSQIDDGSRSKTINIKLKKDKKKGVFGKAMAGYGTDNRQNASLSFNRFSGSRQVSVVGGANNINKQGFSFSDVIGNMGGFSGNMGGLGGPGGMGGRPGGGGNNNPFNGGSNGIATAISGGINYRDVWSPKLEVSSSLFYSNTYNNREQSSFTRFLGLDSTSASGLTSRGTNQNTRFNMRLEYRIDSFNTVLYTPSLTQQHSDSRSLDTSVNRVTKGSLTFMALSAQTASRSNRDGYSLNQNLLWRHRFRRQGRTFTLGWNNSLNDSEGEGTLHATTSVFTDGGSKVSRLQDQTSAQKTESHANVVSSSYTEPLGRNKILELNHAYTNNFSSSDRKTFDYNPATGAHDRLNAPQTNFFQNEFVSNRFGTNFRVQQRKYNYQLGVGLQLGQLVSHTFKALGNKDTVLKQSFRNLFPMANFNYNFTRSKTLRLSYRGRTNQPSVSQLQDVLDLSNPLQVTTGNPALAQEFINNFTVGFNTFSAITFKYWSANVSLTQTANKIVNSIDTFRLSSSDPFRRQITRPINMNGAYAATAFFSLGMPFRNPRLRGSSINLNTSGSFNRNVGMFNKQKNFNSALLLTQSAGLNYSWKEKLDLRLSGSLTYNKVTYRLSPSQNTDFLSQMYGADATYTFPKNFLLSIDFDYFITTGRTAGFNQQVPMWNASFAKQFFKTRQLELKVSVNDLLNQNQSLTRTTSDIAIQDLRTNVLRRYFLVALTYNLNRMGGRNMPPPPMTRPGIQVAH